MKKDGYLLALLYRDPVYDEGPPFGIDEEMLNSLFNKHFDLIKAWVPEKSYQSRHGREEIRWYRLKG